MGFALARARTAWHRHPNGQTIYVTSHWGDHVTDEEYGKAPPIDR